MGGILNNALAGAGEGIERAGFTQMQAEIQAQRDAKLNEYARSMKTDVEQPFQSEQTDKTLQAHKDIGAAANVTHENVARINAAAHRAAANVNKTIASDADGRLFYLDDSKKPVFLTDPETGEPIKGPKDNGLTKAIVESYTSEISSVAKDQLTPPEQKAAQINALRGQMLETLKNPQDFGKGANVTPNKDVNAIATLWRGGGQPPTAAPTAAPTSAPTAATAATPAAVPKVPAAPPADTSLSDKFNEETSLIESGKLQDYSAPVKEWLNSASNKSAASRKAADEAYAERERQNQIAQSRALAKQR